VTFNTLSSGAYLVRQYATWARTGFRSATNSIDYVYSTCAEMLCTPYDQGYGDVHWPVR
jgi:hypothetical protein